MGPHHQRRVFTRSGTAHDRVYAAKKSTIIKADHRTCMYSCHGRRVSSTVGRHMSLLCRAICNAVSMSDTSKLNHYLAAWELSNPQLLTQTMTSHIYTVTHGRTVRKRHLRHLRHWSAMRHAGNRRGAPHPGCLVARSGHPSPHFAPMVLDTVDRCPDGVEHGCNTRDMR